MNRLIIIGNGFDLAHGLKTRYYDFLVWYLQQAFLSSNEKVYSDELIQVTRIRRHQTNFPEDLNFYLDHFFISGHERNQFTGTYSNEYNKPFKLSIKSDFIKELFFNCNKLKWVDIEHYYYDSLIRTLGSNQSKETRIENAKSINDDFDFLKTKFLSYIQLQKGPVLNDYYNTAYFNELSAPIEFRKIITLTKDEIADQERIRVEQDSQKNTNDTVLPQDTLILNFNYTETILRYLKNSFLHRTLGHDPNLIFIHGSAKEENIIFGFGDEIDDNYSILEKQNNKEYLRHIKSFDYFKSSQYHDLVRYLDSKIYEIFIWGHSCGLSDRTLLNMIFENKNCKSIKIYHHKKENGNTNFTELTQEISRHFKNKSLMRNLIVPFNKNDCMAQY